MILYSVRGVFPHFLQRHSLHLCTAEIISFIFFGPAAASLATVAGSYLKISSLYARVNFAFASRSLGIDVHDWSARNSQ